MGVPSIPYQKLDTRADFQISSAAAWASPAMTKYWHGARPPLGTEASKDSADWLKENCGRLTQSPRLGKWDVDEAERVRPARGISSSGFASRPGGSYPRGLPFVLSYASDGIVPRSLAQVFLVGMTVWVSVAERDNREDFRFLCS